MSRCRLFLGLWVLVACVAVVGCGPQTSIKVDGSSTVYRVSEAVAHKFYGEQPRTRVVVSKSGTGGGFKRFAAGEIDICDASRPIKDVEKSACEKAGVEYVELEVAYDGMAIAVNPKNDWCECLTVEQLKSIWEPESAISKWSDINQDWPAKEIKLYGPGTDSGTFDYFTEQIVGTEGSSRDDYMSSEDDNSLVTGVAGDTNALGYFGLAYYEENDDKLKLLGVDSGDGNCVKPTQKTVRALSYKPLSRPLYIYVRKSALERPEVRSFVKFYLDNVSGLVEKVGYVPMPEDEEAEAKQRLQEALDSVKPATKTT
jgi:phosphate transport system substrate-binding protein